MTARKSADEGRGQPVDDRAPGSELRNPTLASLARRAGGRASGRRGRAGASVGAGATLGNRATARRLQRQAGGYGYEFSDDPLNAGGFGPG